MSNTRSIQEALIPSWLSVHDGVDETMCVLLLQVWERKPMNIEEGQSFGERRGSGAEPLFPDLLQQNPSCM